MTAIGSQLTGKLMAPRMANYLLFNTVIVTGNMISLMLGMSKNNNTTFTPAILAVLVGVLFIWIEPVFAITSIDNIRISQKKSETRVVFDMNGGVEHKLFMLKNPHRLVVDISDAKLTIDSTRVKTKNSPVRMIRSAKRNKKDVRVVFDLTDEVKAQSFVLPKSKAYGDRLVIDLTLIKPNDGKPTVSASVEKRSRSQRDLVIAIDAGHGGDDPGAVGVNRMHEKNVVFSIAKKIAALFENEKGYKSILIRDGDYFVSLSARRKMARKESADMFISIHADSFTNKKANGASVFTLSSRGATSASAKFLAERENKADLVGGVSLSDKDDILSSVLVDLSMTYKMESSFDIAEEVLKHLGKVTRLHGARVEKAAFAVLKTPDIPSILVETGFMSNAREARNLSSRRFQQKIANAIFQGVTDYFKEKAPEGTYIASTFRHNRAILYVVERGDTLSQIALRYNVPIKELIGFNSLNDRALNIGQTLNIPLSN